MAPLQQPGNIKWYDSLESTNSTLREGASALDNLSVVAARSQSAGRGQGSHSWFSSPGKNLTCSILYRYGELGGLAVSENILITCVTTLGLLDYLRSRGVEARIKWPNDIWVGGRKICGILIENVLDSKEVRYSVVGVGLNLNETLWPADIPNPVSLTDLTGLAYEPERELPALLETIRRRQGLLATSDGRKSLQEEFGKYVFRLREEPLP